MAQTLVKQYTHIAFSTKTRADLISFEIERELFAYFGGIANGNNSKLLAAGGTANHLHLLVSISKNIALSEFVGDIKRDSSKWIKTKNVEFKNFRWQDGYGAFSVGYAQINDAKRYIDNQKEHHKKKSFEDEFRYFLNKYEMDYDERYVWDQVETSLRRRQIQ
ncbi:MAG: IS200/IS605 family transposase [Pyrinomonadaceae bacterium]